MAELMFPGILYGVPTEEEELNLRQGKIRVWRYVRDTFVEFGCLAMPPVEVGGEIPCWDGIKLATIHYEEPADDSPPGVEMLIDYGEGRTYKVGTDVCQTTHERLIFCIRYIIAERAVDIAEWMSTVPLPDYDEEL